MHSIVKLAIGNPDPFFIKLVFVITGPIEMNLEKTNQSNIQCIATGARPAPNFKWYIADELLENITVTESKEDVEDGKGRLHLLVTVSATTRGDTPSNLANWEEDLDKMKDYWIKEYVIYRKNVLYSNVNCLDQKFI